MTATDNKPNLTATVPANESAHIPAPTPPTAANTVSAVDQLTLLKQKADVLGVTYAANIGVDALKEKIADALSPKEVKEPETRPAGQMTKADIHAEITRALEREHMALVRLRIVNMNPAKSDIPGEIFTFSNKYLGTVRKYIPFGEASDNGYHVPRCLYEQMKEREFLQIKVKKGPNGTSLPDTRWVKEFSLEVLPPLTEAELRTLANKQAAAEGVALD